MSPHQRGSQHHGAKLDEDRVRAARWFRVDGWSVERLAKQFGVSRTAMRKALSGKTWRHAGGPGHRRCPTCEGTGYVNSNGGHDAT